LLHTSSPSFGDMSNTKRKWPEQFGKHSDFEDGFAERVERGLVPTTLKNEGYWNQKSKAFAKKFRKRLDRIQNKKIQEYEHES